MNEAILLRPARDAKGRVFSAAVCSSCRRDASQTKMTRYCEHAMEHSPLRCDDCHNGGMGDG